MKCPVCKTELQDGMIKCPACEFEDLSREFVNVSDAANWVDTVVVPYRNKWESKRNRSPLSMYQELVASQLNRVLSEETVASDFEYDVDEQGAIITRYNGSSESVVIPREIDGHVVYKLGNNLFYKCEELQVVTLPDSLTEIGNGTFMCTSIRTITLPSNIRTIGRSAFSLGKLESINLPDSLTVLGESVFGYSKIKEIVFPKGISVIPPRACESCSKLETAVILGAVNIEESAFACCHKLKNVVFAPQMESVKKGAFAYCESLDLVILPPELKSTAPNAFSFKGYWTDPDTSQRTFVFQDPSTEIKGWGPAPWEECNVVFYCSKGSTAQHHARQYNIEQKALNEFHLNP